MTKKSNVTEGIMRFDASAAFTIAVFLVFSCAEEPLDPTVAEKYVRETVAKMPAPSVTVYIGAVTDETYLPTYRMIAADKKYLLLEELVFIKEANREMPRLTLTDEGRKVFSCERNRCSVPVCTLEVAKVAQPIKVGREWHVSYTVRSRCEGHLYTAFKPLAERQFVRPQEQQGTIVLEKDSEGYRVRIP